MSLNTISKNYKPAICWWITHVWYTGWWFQPLWKIWKSVGMIIPNIWKNKTCSKPPTRWEIMGWFTIALPIHPSIHPFIHPSIHASYHLSMHLSTHSSMHPSNHPSINHSNHLISVFSIYLSIEISIYLTASLHWSKYLLIYRLLSL